MLMHIQHDTENTPGTVQLIALDPTNILIGSGTCYSGIKLDADGSIYIRHKSTDTWSSQGSWLLGGSAGDYYVSRTISDALTTDAGAGPLIMSTDREYDEQQSTVGSNSSTVTFSISDDVSGSPVLTSRAYLFDAIVESLD